MLQVGDLVLFQNPALRRWGKHAFGQRRGIQQVCRIIRLVGKKATLDEVESRGPRIGQRIKASIFDLRLYRKDRGWLKRKKSIEAEMIGSRTASQQEISDIRATVGNPQRCFIDIRANQIGQMLHTW